jgi:hypothetical protein
MDSRGVAESRRIPTKWQLLAITQLVNVAQLPGKKSMWHSPRLRASA